MPDLNKESLSIWNALKPMIDKEIDNRTRGVVQRRKAKVTTAPSLISNTIGVTEPFGSEIMLPFVSNMISATVGDYVWIEWMYGASNAFVSTFAAADEKDFSIAGDLNVLGDASFSGTVYGITASEVGAVPTSGSNGFLYRSSNAIGEKELFKTLWTGSWSAGDITVSGFSNYSMFVLSLDGYDTKITAYISDDGTSLNGVGGFAYSATTDTTYYFSASVSGNTLTLGFCHSRPSSGGVNDRTISKIVGII